MPKFDALDKNLNLFAKTYQITEKVGKVQKINHKIIRKYRSDFICILRRLTDKKANYLGNMGVREIGRHIVFNIHY